LQGAELSRTSGARDSLIRAALASNRGFYRIDPRAHEFLAIVEAAVAIADPADTATYAQLLALLAQSLALTPDAPRRVASAHRALALAEAHRDPILFARIAPPHGALRPLATGWSRCPLRRVREGGHDCGVFGRPASGVRFESRRIRIRDRVG
jgi:hypothetical protein